MSCVMRNAFIKIKKDKTEQKRTIQDKIGQKNDKVTPI